MVSGWERWGLATSCFRYYVLGTELLQDNYIISTVCHMVMCETWEMGSERKAYN